MNSQLNDKMYDNSINYVCPIIAWLLPVIADFNYY